MFILFLLLVSCDGGLAPVEESTATGFRGRITFKGNWPVEFTQTHIVLFKDPLNSAGDFNILNLKFVGNAIPAGSTEYFFTTDGNALINDVKAGEYSYLAVAQSKSIILSLTRDAWEIIGLYSDAADPNMPAKVIVPESAMVDSVNIVCDFDNPPVQPPGG
ncbi:MAG: hypothetical protein KJ799_05010 [Bacteroidetes bacterium]|nr:hypothetical protein [Bacteroidota bacterium]MBU1678815.1 hypothetical protein [Bacteroidota bacterium]MBU2506066.1 hypothetical protein [Bacteroidota bacterium]